MSTITMENDSVLSNKIEAHYPDEPATPYIPYY